MINKIRENYNKNVNLIYKIKYISNKDNEKKAIIIQIDVINVTLFFFCKFLFLRILFQAILNNSYRYL